jgi:hypothetical protein
MSEPAGLLKIRCPSCNRKLGFKPKAVGRKTRCPRCQRSFRVQFPPVPPSASRSGRRSKPTHRKSTTPAVLITIHCPFCGKRMNVPGFAPGRQAQCPACDERFPVTAPLAAGTGGSTDSPENTNILLGVFSDEAMNAQRLRGIPAMTDDMSPESLLPEPARSSNPPRPARPRGRLLAFLMSFLRICWPSRSRSAQSRKS